MRDDVYDDGHAGHEDSAGSRGAGSRGANVLSGVTRRALPPTAWLGSLAAHPLWGLWLKAAPALAVASMFLTAPSSLRWEYVAVGASVTVFLISGTALVHTATAPLNAASEFMGFLRRSSRPDWGIWPGPALLGAARRLSPRLRDVDDQVLTKAIMATDLALSAIGSGAAARRLAGPYAAGQQEPVTPEELTQQLLADATEVVETDQELRAFLAGAPEAVGAFQYMLVALLDVRRQSGHGFHTAAQIFYLAGVISAMVTLWAAVTWPASGAARVVVLAVICPPLWWWVGQQMSAGSDILDMVLQRAVVSQSWCKRLRTQAPL